MSFITGVGLTSFGRHEDCSTLDLMSSAAELAIPEAALHPAEMEGLLRGYAADHPVAQSRERITVADVMASKPVAMPLKLLDCCPVSDGGAAFVVSRERIGETGVRVRGCAQAHTHQYVTTIPQFDAMGAAISLRRAKDQSGIAIGDVRYAGIYDS